MMLENEVRIATALKWNDHPSLKNPVPSKAPLSIPKRLTVMLMLFQETVSLSSSILHYAVQLSKISVPLPPEPSTSDRLKITSMLCRSLLLSPHLDTPHSENLWRTLQIHAKGKHIRTWNRLVSVYLLSFLFPWSHYTFLLLRSILGNDTDAVCHECIGQGRRNWALENKLKWLRA